MRRMAGWAAGVVAMVCLGSAGEEIAVAAGGTLELDIRDGRATNVSSTVVTLGAGATLKLVESAPASTAGFAVYAMSGNGPTLAEWPKLSDSDPLANFAWDRFLGVQTNLHWDVAYANTAYGYAELYSAKWHVAEAGTYSFLMRVDDMGYLSIDGAPVLASTAHCQTVSTNGVELAAGWHDVKIAFGNGSSKFGPVSGTAPAIAYNASNVPLTADNVAAEGARFVDPGDGSVFQPVLLPGAPPRNPLAVKVVTEGAATLDATALGADTLFWLNGGLRASAGTFTVTGAKTVVFGSSALNSHTINFPAFDVPDASFTSPDAAGFVFTNLLTACAVPPPASCGLAVADSAYVAVHGTNTLARLYVDGALELDGWNAYVLAGSAVPEDVPIRVGAGCQLRYKPCYWSNIWTWYGQEGTLTNAVELLDATASVRFSSGQNVHFHGSIAGVGDVIQDGTKPLFLHAALSQTGKVSVDKDSALIIYQDTAGTPSNTLEVADNSAVAFEPVGVGGQPTTVRVGTFIGHGRDTAFNARARQTVEIGTLDGYVFLNGAADGTSAFAVADTTGPDVAIFAAPGVTCTLRGASAEKTAVRAVPPASGGASRAATSLELAGPSLELLSVNADVGQTLLLSGTGTVNLVKGKGVLRLAEGADIRVRAFDATAHVDAGAGTLTVLPAEATWRDKVLLWLDPTDASTLSVLTSNKGVEQTYTNGYKLIEAWYDKRPGQRDFFALNNRKWSQKRYDLQPQVYPYLVTAGGPNGLPYLSFGTYQKSVAGVGPNGGTTTEARRLQFWRGPVATSGNTVDAYASTNVAWAAMVFGSQQGGGGAILGTEGGLFKRAGQTLSNPISSNKFTLYADGVKVTSTSAKFNGGWQLLSFDVANTNVNAIAWNTKYDQSGGQNYGEIILFGEKPTDAERIDCEKYLAAKWGLASSAYDGEGEVVMFAGAGDVALTDGANAVASGIFRGVVSLSGGALAIPGLLPIDEADVPSAGRVAWYDPNLPGALAMSTVAARPLCVRALVERDNGGVASGSSYLLGTYTGDYDRRPWLSVGSRGGAATNWIDFSNIYGEARGNTLRRREGTPPAKEDNATTGVVPVNVRTAFVALDSSNGGGMPLLDTVGATGLIKARVPPADIGTPIWTNATVAAVTGGVTRLDGTKVNGTVAGYNGWPEVLSLETTENVPISYFGYYGVDKAATPNVEILGEILLYDTPLDGATRAGIEAYLMKKWTGRLPKGYADFRSATVTGSGIVRAQTVASLPSFADFAGTGVVAQAEFAFTLDASATPAVPDALAATCALALPAACTATVTCAAKPRPGTYTLLSAPSFARPVAWTLNTAGATEGTVMSIRVTGTAVLLDVISPGTVLFFR